MFDQLRDGCDVVVVGGGAAGLSGALMLARARRSVVVLDAGTPRNAPAGGVHGLLARDGIRPAELLERGRAEVRGYGGHVVPGEVVAVTRDASGFAVTLALVAEETRQAVAVYRDPFSVASEARVCDLVLGDRRHGL